MATVIDGKAVAKHIKEQVKAEYEALTEKTNKQCGLAVIIVGEDSASKVYVRNKRKACEEVGFISREYALSADTTEATLLELIEKLNKDNGIHGILVQLPLPKGINEERITQAIAANKDVDSFCYENVGRLVSSQKASLLPCTPAGIVELLKFYNIPIEGKNCVIVGRSNIVGKPLALMMLKNNATVTVCHSKTKSLREHCKNADILISAVGKRNIITSDTVKENAVVIDVGMNRDENNKLCGDVDFEAVKEKASFITPVPGGVGPMTIAMLMKNTLESFKNSL